MAKADVITKEVEGIIADVWNEHSRNGWGAKEIREEVTRKVQEKWPGKHPLGWPGLRAVQHHLEGVKEKAKEVKANGLDDPWCIGACLKDNIDISADMISMLLELQKVGQKVRPDIKMTIRQARWFARLYPIVQKVTKKQNIAEVIIQLSIIKQLKLDKALVSGLVELYKLIENANEQLKQSDKEQLNRLVGLAWLVLIGIQYAKKEQVSELVKEEYPDTSELDNLYFIRQDLSAEALLDGLWDVYATPEQKKEKADILANFKEYSVEELEPIYGKLTPNQVDLVNDFARSVLSSTVAAREWKERHPKEFEELAKLLEEKEHERAHSTTE